MSRVTFVTGASSGLGAALAPLFAADGDTVVLTARRAESLEQLADGIRATGGRALPLALDVTDRAAVLDAVRRVEAEAGPVDLLIANAGIGEPTPATRFDSATLERVFRTNVFGVSYCIEAVLPGMIERRAGQIVGISSLAAYRGLPGNASYCASKSAVNALLESLRVELRQHGVTVSIVAPGFVKTPLTARNKFPMPFILDVDDAARRMHRAIRAGRTEYAFPWQLASIVRTGRLLPNALYDRLLKGKKIEKDPV